MVTSSRDRPGPGPVLLLAPFDPRRKHGGGARRIDCFMRGLARHRKTVALLPAVGGAAPAPDEVPPGLVRLEGRSGSRWAQVLDLRLLRLALRAARKEPPCMVFATSYPTFPLGMFLSRLLRVPLVIDEHNLEAPRLRRVGRPWLARLVGAVERAALRQAAMVVAVSEEDAIALQDEYGLRDRPHVAPNGYDAGVLHVDAGRRTSTRRAMGFRDDECVMIFVGDVVYAPNRDAVRALRDQVLPAVLKILPTARLLLVAGPGEPPGASHERATNLGSVPDVAPILNAADVLVAPLWSGGGTKLKVIEALATGLAVVTTPEGVRGLEECRSLDAVRVVDRVEDMPQAVRDLFASYRRAAPPDWFVERFEWKPIGQRLLRALQERGLL